MLSQRNNKIELSFIITSAPFIKLVRSLLLFITQARQRKNQIVEMAVYGASVTMFQVQCGLYRVR